MAIPGNDLAKTALSTAAFPSSRERRDFSQAGFRPKTRSWQPNVINRIVQPKYKVENATQLKVPIIDLARLILDFTDNPYFKEAAVLETQQANKARLDLENIIVISENVRDLSKRLNHGGISSP